MNLNIFKAESIASIPNSPYNYYPSFELFQSQFINHLPKQHNKSCSSFVHFYSLSRTREKLYSSHDKLCHLSIIPLKDFHLFKMLGAKYHVGPAHMHCQSSFMSLLPKVFKSAIPFNET